MCVGFYRNFMGLLFQTAWRREEHHTSLCVYRPAGFWMALILPFSFLKYFFIEAKYMDRKLHISSMHSSVNQINPRRYQETEPLPANLTLLCPFPAVDNQHPKFNSASQLCFPVWFDLQILTLLCFLFSSWLQNYHGGRNCFH